MAIRDLVKRYRGTPVRVHGGRDPIRAFREQMNRMVEDLWDTFGLASLEGVGEGLLGLRGLTPRIDVREDKESVEVIAELPGLSEKEVQVNLGPGRDLLTIRGEKRDEREERRADYYYSERSFGSFHRDVELPAVVKEEGIDAIFKNGVLTIKLPKASEQEGGSRRIDIKPR